jgi:hypothetical protein
LTATLTTSWTIPPRENRREEGAAYSCPFSGEGRFVYIGKLLKVHIIPEANSLDLTGTYVY